MKRTPKQHKQMLALSKENEKLSKFEMDGQQFLNVGCDLRTNLVTIKNLSTGKYEEINFYELKEKMDV